MEQSFQKGVVLHLASFIEYTEGGVISKQLIKSPAGNITLFSFDKGEGLSEEFWINLQGEQRTLPLSFPAPYTLTI